MNLEMLTIIQQKIQFRDSDIRPCKGHSLMGHEWLGAGPCSPRASPVVFL